MAAELNEADSEVSIKAFSEQSLRDFLSDPSRFYLIGTINRHIAGAIHGYVFPHPTGVKYMWIDEVDTIAQFRRQGVATAMLKEVFEIAKEHGCDEAWLGTENDNPGAMALYEGLNPTEHTNGPTYAWKIPWGRKE
ncbi:GNAT family N-acetyltransferase [Candidatus Saccharibacteria bacterium]|nr:GNAT family N-acetyltransferase [Candidatus Saccharibacteria bacterium]